MTEQWQELKETITEMRDSNGTCTQQEVCKFLVNYMEILEKQMQEPILDKIRAEINELSSYVARFNGGDFAIHIDKEQVLQIIDKYRGEVDCRECKAEYECYECEKYEESEGQNESDG